MFVRASETTAIMMEAREKRRNIDAVRDQIAKAIEHEARKGSGEVDVYPSVGLMSQERNIIKEELTAAGYGVKWKAVVTDFEHIHIWWEKKD